MLKIKRGEATIMLVQTHYMISNYIFEYFQTQKIGKLIDKKSFSYGNIKPDIDFGLKNLDHTIYSTKIHIDYELKRINHQDLSKEAFSESLGMILHYLCDSFCAYHNQDHLIKESLFKHFLYEHKIHAKLKKKIELNKLKPIFKIPSEESPENILSTIFEKYSNKIRKPGRDLRFALGTSLILSNYILQKRLKKISVLEKGGLVNYEKYPYIYTTNRTGA